MRRIVLGICLLLTLGGLSAWAANWQPTPGHKQIPLWPGAVPDAQSVGAETVKTTKPLVAGKPWLEVDNVSQPTVTMYAPKEKNSGAAVIVFPGGGYKILAIDLEGTEVCDWLTSKGFTCVVLKYRVPDSGPHWEARCKCQIIPKSPTALEDAKRTVGLVRFHAGEWHINPHKIGVLGFSSGGHLVAAISTHFDKRLYSPVDAADKESCRPDFAVAIYPGHLWISGKEKFALNPDIHCDPGYAAHVLATG